MKKKQIATNKFFIATKSLNLASHSVWDIAMAFDYMKEAGISATKRTTERRLNAWGIFPEELSHQNIADEFNRPANNIVLGWAIKKARRARNQILFVQLHKLPDGQICIHANDSRGKRFWAPIRNQNTNSITEALIKIQFHVGKSIAVFPHGALVNFLRDTPSFSGINLCPQAYQPVLLNKPMIKNKAKLKVMPSPHLNELEAESIHIIREAVAESENPAMLYSVGKDSGVMLHLAKKAFFPAKPPFPLLHIDTRWKFQEMYLFRDFMAQDSKMELLVHTNPEAIIKNINPFDHGSTLHTEITKTEGLKQALDKYKFDVIFGGARRDEEKSRAKERVFSFRTSSHQWDPKNQRPELWNLFNTRKNTGESIRVFPLSNWTELDIWQYIYQENIPMVPLYFAKYRPVVVRPEIIMMVDDDRCQLLPDEHIQMLKVRFRTLGCYPLTGAIESNAETIEDILLEIVNARQSERQGRKIDTDSSGSMEKKKQDGYF